MPILYEDTDKMMQNSWDTTSFLIGAASGLFLGALIFTAVGREMVKTAAGITEEEIRRRIKETEERRKKG